MGCIRERQISMDSVSSRGAPHIDDAVFDLYKNPESETLSSSGLLKVPVLRQQDLYFFVFYHRRMYYQLIAVIQ